MSLIEMPTDYEQEETIIFDPMVSMSEEDRVFTISPLGLEVAVTRSDYRYIIRILCVYLENIIPIHDSYKTNIAELMDFYQHILKSNIAEMDKFYEAEIIEMIKDHQLKDLIFKCMTIYKIYGYPYESQEVLNLFTNLATVTQINLNQLTTQDVQKFFDNFSQLLIKMNSYGIIPKILTTITYAFIFQFPDALEWRQENEQDFNNQDIFRNIILSNYKQYLVCEGDYISARLYYNLLFPKSYDAVICKKTNKQLDLPKMKLKIINHIADKYKNHLKTISRIQLVSRIAEREVATEALENLVSAFFDDSNIQLRADVEKYFQLEFDRLSTQYPEFTGIKIGKMIFPHVFIFRRPRVFTLLNLYAANLSKTLRDFKNTKSYSEEKIDTIKKDLCSSLKSTTRAILSVPLITKDLDFELISVTNLKTILDLVRMVSTSNVLKDHTIITKKKKIVV